MTSLPSDPTGEHWPPSITTLLERIDRLEARVQKLEGSTTAPVLPAWCDQPFDLTESSHNPLVPFLGELSIRTRNALMNAGYDRWTNEYTRPLGYPPVVRTTRELINLSHAQLYHWKNFGRKSIGDLVKILAAHGVRWPVRGAGR